MSKLFVLVGLPASGKSTYAEFLKKEYNAEVISSDELREELYGNVNDVSHNTEIFAEMFKRTKYYLSKEVNVVYDATNLNSKKRKALLDQFKNHEKICYYFSIPNLAFVSTRNSSRERKVPYEVIVRMYENLQIPMYHEGWDDIKIIHQSDVNPIIKNRTLGIFEIDNISHDDLFFRLGYYFSEFSRITDFPQDSKYHSLSVSRHIYYVYDYIYKNYKGENKDVMMWSALLHDIGKYYCKNFKENSRYANFIGHENVSSQTAINILRIIGYDDEFILKVATIVQLHMRLMNNENPGKLANSIGNDLYKKLVLFHEADLSAK